MLQVIKLSTEDQINLYMKSCSKRKLAEMLTECNRLLDLKLALNGEPEYYVTTVTGTDYPYGNGIKLASPDDIFSRLVDLYHTEPLQVANICDQLLDRSGVLLGKIRDVVRSKKQPAV